MSCIGPDAMPRKRQAGGLASIRKRREEIVYQQFRDQNPNPSVDQEWGGWLIAALTDIKFRPVC
jgi:hypothetical protein